MSTGDLLNIDPLELKFNFELWKQISASLRLINKTDSNVAFKVKTTNPKKYCVRPNTGIVSPRSSCEIIVTMQAQKEAPPDMQCKDKFLLQSVRAPEGAAVKDITAEMFNKQPGHVVEECKLRVVYVSPPQQAPVGEEVEETSSTKASISDNGNVHTSELTGAPKTVERFESQEKTGEAKAIISKLTQEKNDALHLNSKLRRELDQLRSEGTKSQGGLPLIYVILVGILGILLGYIMKS